MRQSGVRFVRLFVLCLTVAIIASGAPAPVSSEQPDVARLDRTVLPIPDPPFTGVVERTLGGSKPDYPTPVKAPAGAPNVVLDPVR